MQTKRRFTCTALMLAGMLISAGCASTDAVTSSAADALADDALVGNLTSGLGIDAAQAGGGLGSIMSLAENKLPASDYSSLTRLLPNSDKYLQMAKDAGLLTDPITDTKRLGSAMNKLGISPATASNLYSQFGDYIGKAGGSTLGESVTGLFK